jgi:hypothetical protein
LYSDSATGVPTLRCPNVATARPGETSIALNFSGA